MAKHFGLALAIAIALASAHCAGGGPSGTHLSVVKGNVVDADVVRGPRHREPTLAVLLAKWFEGVGRAWAQSSVEGIRVSIEGTPFETVTDADGNFLIEGDFAGSITLLFERETDGLAARIGFEVPEGATVTLHNVSCRGSEGLCEAEDIDVDHPSDGSESEPDDGSDGDGIGSGPDGTPPIQTPGDPPIPTPGNPRLPTPGNPRLPTPGDSPIPTPGDPPIPTPPHPPVPTPRNPPVPTPRNPPVPTPRNPPVPTPRNRSLPTPIIPADQAAAAEGHEDANASAPEPAPGMTIT